MSTISISPSQEQQLALDALKKFAESSVEEADTFVLTGFAGTGKTTMVRFFLEWCKMRAIPTTLLATTGRAAKILKEKTGQLCETLHAAIYVFGGVESTAENQPDPEKTEEGQLVLNFNIKSSGKKEEDKTMIYLVDESSMISHETEPNANTAQFGTGNLLEDFFRFATGHKIVFVGDPCQLPPVASNPFSAALSPFFLQEKLGRKCFHFRLTEIKRQANNSEILRLAGKFRKDLEDKIFVKYPKLIRPKSQQCHLLASEEELLLRYLKIREEVGPYEVVFIAHANFLVQQLNLTIRQALGKGNQLEPGDLLMITQNNRLSNLVNGDLVEVLEIKNREMRAGLHMLKVIVKNVSSGLAYESYLIEDLLYDGNPNLSQADSQKLLIDFDKRMRAMGVSRNSFEYNQALLSDNYANAIRAKFGYAITCHKAQGGEWQHVFLNIHKNLYSRQGEDLYRWYYTALTRASDHLYVNNGWWIFN